MWSLLSEAVPPERRNAAMRILVAVVTLIFALAGSASAQAFGPLNPSLASWIAPIVNADGTPLKDLSGYQIRIVGPLPAAAITCPAYSATVYTVKKSVPSLTTTPLANTPVTFGTAGSGNVAGDLGLTADGQYCGVATAVDL